MAQVQFIDNPEYSKNTSRINFFSLKNDGDDAIVRFMEDSVHDFDIVTAHNVKVEGRNRKVSCLRGSSREPIENCPLCAVNAPVAQHIYIRLIQYVKDENGNVVAEPKVWERSMKYAYTLRDYIKEYGQLSECLFKVKRNGAAGSVNTDYSLMYLSKEMYPDSIYVKSGDAFTDYHTLGTVVLDKSAEEMKSLASSNSFPSVESSQINNPSPAPVPPTPPVGNAGYAAPERPVRYY